MRTKIKNLSKAGRIVLALGVAGAAFGIATAVQAAIPDNGVIHGCYGKAGTPFKGELRVRDSNEQCRSYENPLDWNQTGPKGATGDTGPKGPTGDTGPKGPTGPAGTARAWAIVESDGTILHKANIAAVDHPSTGQYCVIPDGVDVWGAAAVATVNQGWAGRDVAEASPADCSNHTGVLVTIWNTASSALAEDNFSIVIP